MNGSAGRMRPGARCRGREEGTGAGVPDRGPETAKRPLLGLGRKLPAGVPKRAYPSRMPHEGSYLWRLRQHVGNDLVLMPGAMVVLQRDDDCILLTKRADDASWCLPGGAAEPGGGFAQTAIDEVAEEAGVQLAEADLVPFGSLSRADLHTIRYPSGDVTHCFALCFLARRWEGEPRADGEESSAVKFAPLDALPEPLHNPTAHAIDLFRAYLKTGVFQLR